MQPVDKKGRQRQLDRDHNQIEEKDPSGVAAGAFHGDVDIVEEVDDHDEQLHGKIARTDGDQLLGRARQTQEGHREGQDRQQHQQTDREADGVQAADAAPHKLEIALAVDPADLDPRADGQTAAHGGQNQVDLRQIGDGRDRFLADMGGHHRVKNGENHGQPLIERQRRADGQHDPPHRRVQAFFEVQPVFFIQLRTKRSVFIFHHLESFSLKKQNRPIFLTCDFIDFEL